MHKNNSTSSIFFLFAFIIFSNTCQAKHIESLQEIDKSKFNHSIVTTSYKSLADAKFMSEYNVYRYHDYILQVLNKDNLNQIQLQIEHQPESKQLGKLQHEFPKLPWWSNNAPSILKNLDFSKVDGNSDQYQLSNNITLYLLPHQGNWGKVYVLRQRKQNSAEEIICAVKLLLTRNDRMEKGVDHFRKRHYQEIATNMQLTKLNLNFAITPMGITKIDADHYLLFLPYGEHCFDRFKQQNLDITVAQFTQLMQDVDQLHTKGYAHGDLKLSNVLFINNKLKLCDWFSLINYNQETVGKYRYIGDNLPPEAMRAFYFKTDNLEYSAITEAKKSELYILHPVSADRFCLAISMLEILEPDLYAEFDKLSPRGFNPYSPENLDFWPKNIAYLKKMQQELHNRADQKAKPQHKQLLHKIAQYVDIDPMLRN